MSLKHCEVKSCKGVYEESIIYYCNLRLVNTPNYTITKEEYEKLEDKSNYHPVISERCSECNDDLETRLLNFIKENFIEL